MIQVPDLAKKLGLVPHFKGLQQPELEKIILLGRIQSFPASQLIFQENSPCAGLFVLLSGQIQLTKMSLQGQNAILAIYNPIIMFNEVAALDLGPNPVTSEATEDTTVWRLDTDQLEVLFQRYPQTGLGLARVLAARNRHLVGRYEDVSFRPVLVRTARLLLSLTQNGIVPIDRRKHPLHRMAALIATVPEAFSRSLKVLRLNGDIHCTTSTITILHVDKLQEIAEIQPGSF
jgi:CRP-like cAMP-binding protein